MLRRGARVSTNGAPQGTRICPARLSTNDGAARMPGNCTSPARITDSAGAARIQETSAGRLAYHLLNGTRQIESGSPHSGACSATWSVRCKNDAVTISTLAPSSGTSHVLPDVDWCGHSRSEPRHRAVINQPCLPDNLVPRAHARARGHLRLSSPRPIIFRE